MISFASWIRACRFGPHYNECRRIATNLDAVSNIKLDSRISCEQRRHEGTTSTLTGPLPPKHATNVALDGGTNNNRNIINNNTNNSSQRNTTARLHSLAKMPVSVTYSIIQLVQDRKFSQAVYEYQRIQRDANNSSNKLFINAAFVQALIKAFFALSTDSATARKYADEADKLFARLKQRYMETQDAIARPNSNIYTLLISLNRKAGDTERMEKLMQEAQENFKGKSAAKLQHIISDASIMALGRTGRLREALETFDTMRRDGTANMHSYSAAISAYSANGNTGQMRRIFEEMTQKFGPNIIALNSVLEGYAKNRKYEEAVSLFESIYGDGDYTAAISNNNNNNIRYPLPIDYTYNVMFRVYGKCSSIDYKRAWSQVRNLYHQMHATGVVPNSYIYTALVSACTSIMCRAMEDEEARKNGGGGTSAAAAATTTATATAEAARQSLMEMIDEIQGHVVAQNMCDSHQLQPRSSAIYNSLINAHCKMGRVESAKALLETMQKQLIEPNAHTFAPIIDYYCARGDTKGTRDILAEMKRSGVEPNTFIYNTLMWACSRRGDHDTLWGLFNEMRNSSEQKQPDRRSYELAVRSSFEQGEQKRAMELLDEMKSRGLGPTAEVVNVAAEHLIRLGQCETAMQMLRSIRSRSRSSSVEAHHQPDQADSKTVALLIKAAVESKQYDQAIDVFKQASKAKPGGATSLLLTTEIYNAAIDCYVRQFRHDKANAILREMKQRASADPSGRCKPNHLTYSLVISAFVQRRKLEYPVVLLNEMRRMGMRPMPWVYREFLARVSSSPASARFLIPVPVVAPKSEQQQQQQQQQQQEKKGQQQQQQQQQLATQEFTRDQLVDYLYQCMQDDGYDLRDRTVCDALLPTFEARVKDVVMPTYCASSEWEAEQERQAGSFEDFYYINQYRPTSSS